MQSFQTVRPQYRQDKFLSRGQKLTSQFWWRQKCLWTPSPVFFLETVFSLLLVIIPSPSPLRNLYLLWAKYILVDAYPIILLKQMPEKSKYAMNVETTTSREPGRESRGGGKSSKPRLGSKKLLQETLSKKTPPQHPEATLSLVPRLKW